MATLASIVLVAVTFLLLPAILLAGGGAMGVRAWTVGRGRPLGLRLARAGGASALAVLAALHASIMIGLLAFAGAFPGALLAPAALAWLALLAAPYAAGAALARVTRRAAASLAGVRAARRKVDVRALRYAIERRSRRVERRIQALAAAGSELTEALVASRREAEALCGALADVESALRSGDLAASGRRVLLLAERAELELALGEHERRLTDLEADALLAHATAGRDGGAFGKLATEARLFEARVEGARMARTALA